MAQKRFTPDELLALQAVYRGCNTNKKIFGAIYVHNIGADNEKSISYFDALDIVDKMIETEIKTQEES